MMLNVCCVYLVFSLSAVCDCCHDGYRVCVLCILCLLVFKLLFMSVYDVVCMSYVFCVVFFLIIVHACCHV